MKQLEFNPNGGYDEPRGIIIGEIINMEWQLFYDGRPQSRQMKADDEDFAMSAAKKKKRELLAKLGGYPCYLFPDDSKWEMRLWVYS